MIVAFRATSNSNCHSNNPFVLAVDTEYMWRATQSNPGLCHHNSSKVWEGGTRVAACSEARYNLATRVASFLVWMSLHIPRLYQKGHEHTTKMSGQPRKRARFSFR